MDYNLIVSLTLGGAFIGVFALYLHQHKSYKLIINQQKNDVSNTQNGQVQPVPNISDVVTATPMAQDQNVVTGYAVRDASGTNVITAHQVFKFSSNAMDVSDNKELLSWATHLATDIVKAGMTTPNKSIELVFKNHIQQGLDSGEFEMMTTKANEVLADAINSKTGQIVGKGRVVEAGKTKQMLTGGFHLLSIAVAQSHLADINQKLEQFNTKLDGIKDHLEGIETSKIKGSIGYYQEVIDRIESNQLNMELEAAIATNLEACVKDSHQWVNATLDKFSTLIDKLKVLKDKDIVGTGDTFNDLKALLKDVKNITNDYDLILQFNNISNAVLGYIDPKEQAYTRMNIQSDKWESLVNKFKNIGREKIKQVFQKAIFNSSETLDLRRENIEHGVNNCHLALMESLNQGLLQNNLIAEQMMLLKRDEIRMGIAFDESEQIKQAVILN